MDANIATFAQGQQGQCASPGLPGLQYSSYPYQVPDGFGAYYGSTQQSIPQGWYGNVLGGSGGQFGNLIPNSGFGQQAWAAQPIATGFGFGIPQGGGSIGGIGNQLSGFIGPQQAAQHAAQQAAQAAQQVAQQASLQVAQQAGQAAQQIAQQVAQQAAQQVALQIAQQASQVAQQVAHQVAQQAAQQVNQQAAQVAQVVAHQAVQQVLAGCGGQQQAYSPWNALGAQFANPQQQWASQGSPGNLGQAYQPFGIQGGAFGYPQLGAFGGLTGQLPYSLTGVPQWAYPGLAGNPQGGFMRGLNPFAGVPLGTQTQFGASPRFSFA